MWNKDNLLEALLNFFWFKTLENILVLGSKPIKNIHGISHGNIPFSSLSSPLISHTYLVFI
jgi:hypothetical protein